MSFWSHFHFKSVLSSNTHSWLDNIYYSSGVAEVLPVLPILFNSAQLFFLLHDNHFETNEKNLIELMNRLQSIDWYDGLDESIFFFLVFFPWRKLHLISLLFVHYSVIKLRYFWWNYFLNNFRLLIGLLRLVCLLVVGH